MHAKHWLGAAAVWLSLGFLALPVQAAPVGSMNGDFRAATGDTSAVDRVHRRCWWHHGRRYCREFRRGYYERDRGYYPYYAPGFSLYFGGHRHRHRHHHPHWR